MAEVRHGEAKGMHTYISSHFRRGTFDSDCCIWILIVLIVAFGEAVNDNNGAKLLQL